MKRGQTLLETILAMSLLMMVVAAIFSVFDLGQGSFHLSVMRNDLQNQGRGALVWLERDVIQTALSNLAVADGPARSVNGSARHAVCVTGLDDWTEPANFDPVSGLPRWNRYLVYYATTEPEGRLIRLEVSLASNINGAWSDFVNYLDNDPESMSLPSGYVLEGYRVLARDVREFRLAPEDETLLFELQLRRREAARMTGSEARDETLELHLEATPLNG